MGRILSRNSKQLITLLLAILLLINTAACSTVRPDIPTQPASPPTLQVTSTVTTTNTPTIEPSATQTLTSTPLPTTTPPSSFSAAINANSALLRSGPGGMHQPILRYPYGTTVTITGKAAGDEWVFIQAADQNTGWLSVQYLDLDYPLSAVPVQVASETELIYGVIQDSTGSRLSGVGISVCIDLCYQSQRTDSVSNENGEFFAYIPSAIGNQLRVFVSSVNCGSPLMGTDCQLRGTFMPEEIMVKAVPNINPLLFMYYPPTQ